MAEPLLRVRGLNAWYGESHALHGVDLDILPGETVTLVGRNGVGKTTTLRAIMGIIPKRTGEIRFDGRDMIRVPLHRTAHYGIGFVPEERAIFSSLTVEENLLLPPVVAPGGMEIAEIYRLFPNLEERRASPRHRGSHELTAGGTRAARPGRGHPRRDRGDLGQLGAARSRRITSQRTHRGLSAARRRRHGVPL